MISVIVPTYNRKENLKLCLECLGAQEGYRDFEIIVVDDGSTDGTAEWLRDLTHINAISFRYLSAGPHRGFQAGRARNIGAANANPHSSLFVLTDSDVLFPPHIINRYYELHTAFSNHVIIGLYHFLLRMDFGVENLHNDSDFWFRLESMNYPKLPMLPDASLKGRKDPRYDHFPEEPKSEFYEPTPLGLAFGMGCFSGNIGYPREVYWDIGGFDETLIGHGGEDCDFAMMAIEHGHKFVRDKKLVGYHRWHARYTDEMVMRQEVDANIERIDKKHKIGRYATEAVDPPPGIKEWWSDYRLYTKERGARLVYDGTNTYWALFGIHRLGLSNPKAVADLGFEWGDADPITDEKLAEFQVEGTHNPDV